MPNSDGNSTIASNRSLEQTVGQKKSPIRNGIRDDEKQNVCCGNGDSSSMNGNFIDTSYRTAEISSTSPLTMKIIRKRHSDSEMMHENIKKTKLDSCDTPRSEPSPLVNDITHEPFPIPKAINEKVEDKEILNNSEIENNDPDQKEQLKDNDSSSSSIIVIDEENDSPAAEAKEEEKPEASQAADADGLNTLKNESILKTEVKEEVTIQCDATSVGTQTSRSDRSATEDERLLVRADVLGVYSENLKKATTSSLSLLQKLTQSRALQNNNWQAKYYQLHNRFLHLKVSTDKMVENVSKDEKECRSTEAQTENLDSHDVAHSSAVHGSHVTNGLSPNSQTVNNRPHLLRQLGVNSPTKTSNGSTISTTNPVNSNVHPTHSSQQTQQLQQPTVVQNLPVNSQHQPTTKPLVNQQHLEHIQQSQMVQQQQKQQTQLQQQQQPQPQPQQPQQPQQQQQPSQQQQTHQAHQVFLLSPRSQAALQNSHIVTLSSGSSNVIDLTDDDSSANLVNAPASSLRSTGITSISRGNNRQGPSSIHESTRVRHPMALPRMTSTTISQGCCRGLPPPSPHLTVTRTEDGVCLQWNIPNYTQSVYSKIKRYRLFNYSQTPQSVFYSFQNPWKEIGSVDSMDLPMACTLTQIQENSVYHFAIRPVDEYERLGVWSNTATIEMSTLDS